MASTTPLDPASVATAALAVWVTPAAAEVLGVYFVIILASFAGAGWALMRKEKSSVRKAIGFVTLMAATSTLLTVGVAEVLRSYMSLDDSRWLLAPVALFLAGIGHDWPRVIPWALDKALSIFVLLKGGNPNDFSSRSSQQDNKPDGADSSGRGPSND